MNQELDPQQISGALSAQADQIDAGPPPLTSIVRRGRARQRSRMAGVTAVALLGGLAVGIGGMELSNRGGDQLAVSPSAAGSEVPPPSIVTNLQTTPTPVFDGYPPSVMSTETFPVGAVPYMGGFLITEWSTNMRSAHLTFLDGDTQQTTDLGSVQFPTQAAGWMSANLVDADENRVVFAATSAGRPEAVDVLTSTDGSAWAALGESVALAGVPLGVEGVIDVTAVPVHMALKGDRWLMGVEPSVTLDPQLLEDLAPGFDPGLEISDDGASLTSSADLSKIDVGDDGPTDRLVTAADLGLTNAELQQYSSLPTQWFVGSVSTGEVKSVSAPGNPDYSIGSVLAFGDYFIASLGDPNVVLSTDGESWFEIEAVNFDDLVAVGEVDGDAVVVLERQRGVASTFRIEPDRTLTELGTLTCPGGQALYTGDPRMAVLALECIDVEPAGERDGENVSGFMGGTGSWSIGTVDFDITFSVESSSFAEPSSSAGNDEDVLGSQEILTYTVRDATTGEILAENTRVADDRFNDGEVIDGERVVVFSDAGGRPDVLVPMADLDDPESFEMGGWDAGMAESEDAGIEADSGIDESSVSTAASADQSPPPGSGRFVSADGVTWVELEDRVQHGEPIVLGQSGSRFLVAGGHWLLLDGPGADATEREPYLEIVDISQS